MMSSLLLNSMFAMGMKQHTTVIGTRLHQLQYEYGHGTLSVPYYESMEGWEISVAPSDVHGNNVLLFRAEHPEQGQSIENRIRYAH
ncbi:hypothetical protein U1E44_08415 [Arenibacter sp. GZD96]|nr:hypothetical protein [Arenibacter sp. GZD-96]